MSFDRGKRQRGMGGAGPGIANTIASAVRNVLADLPFVQQNMAPPSTRPYTLLAPSFRSFPPEHNLPDDYDALEQMISDFQATRSVASRVPIDAEVIVATLRDESVDITISDLASFDATQLRQLLQLTANIVLAPGTIVALQGFARDWFTNLVAERASRAGMAWIINTTQPTPLLLSCHLHICPWASMY
jgi:hypothetical protein